MTEMNEHMAIERLSESMKKASALARQLAFTQKNKSWYQIAANLDILRVNSVRLATSKALTRQEVLSAVNTRQLTLKV